METTAPSIEEMILHPPPKGCDGSDGLSASRVIERLNIESVVLEQGFSLDSILKIQDHKSRLVASQIGGGIQIPVVESKEKGLHGVLDPQLENPLERQTLAETMQQDRLLPALLNGNAHPAKVIGQPVHHAAIVLDNLFQLPGSDGQPKNVRHLPVRQKERDQNMVGIIGKLVQKGCPPPLKRGEILEAGSVCMHFEEMVVFVSASVFSKEKHFARFPDLPGQVRILECRDENGGTTRDLLNLEIHSSIERCKPGNGKPVRGEAKAVPVWHSKEVIDGNDAGARITGHGAERNGRHDGRECDQQGQGQKNSETPSGA
jgi:hypothetical protein